MSGRDLANQEFSFTLSGNGTTETVKNGADGSISFSKLTFDKAGEYKYTVKEEATTEAGVTIDSKIYNITVTVTDNGNGQLAAAISGDTTTGSDLDFVNSYKADRDSKGPQTGDNSNMLLWIAILFVSSGAFAVTTVYGKKRNEAE